MAGGKQKKKGPDSDKAPAVAAGGKKKKGGPALAAPALAALAAALLLGAVLRRGGHEESDPELGVKVACTPADGPDCIEPLVYPDCEHSCNYSKIISLGCGNTEPNYPVCPRGPKGCSDCRDQHNGCPGFAGNYGGKGCEDNPPFMIEVCPHTCNVCHLRDKTPRCKHVREMPPAVEKGSINRTFERMLRMKGLNVDVISRDPWIVKLSNFLTQTEIDFLLDAQIRGPFKQAADMDGIGKTVHSANRRTDVAWCDCHCQNHPVTRRLFSRIGEVLRVHPHYTESMQFLRYTKGMYYKPHHDSPHINRHVNFACKHRIYTFFMYLNDVPQGGATAFPSLNITIKPERGSAILWPSVYDHDPYVADQRTTHEALAVEKGEKLSVNVWWTQGPRVLSDNLGCDAAPINFR